MICHGQVTQLTWFLEVAPDLLAARLGYCDLLVNQL